MEKYGFNLQFKAADVLLNRQEIISNSVDVEKRTRDRLNGDFVGNVDVYAESEVIQKETFQSLSDRYQRVFLLECKGSKESVKLFLIDGHSNTYTQKNAHAIFKKDNCFLQDEITKFSPDFSEDSKSPFIAFTGDFFDVEKTEKLKSASESEEVCFYQRADKKYGNTCLQHGIQQIDNLLRYCKDNGLFVNGSVRNKTILPILLIKSKIYLIRYPKANSQFPIFYKDLPWVAYRSTTRYGSNGFAPYFLVNYNHFNNFLDAVKTGNLCYSKTKKEYRWEES